MKKIICAVFMVGLLFAAMNVSAEEEVLFSFEDGLEGWDVPDWAYEKQDHVQRQISSSDAAAKVGNNSLEIIAEFPGGSWSGAIVEVAQYFNWSDYKKIACDIYIPVDAPKGLKGKMILTVGETWKWVEMSRDFELIPGEWVTIKADITPGSIDWKRTQVNDAFRQDIRKLDIRVVSNGQPAYSGPLYIDNVRVIK